MASKKPDKSDDSKILYGIIGVVIVAAIVIVAFVLNGSATHTIKVPAPSNVSATPTNANSSAQTSQFPQLSANSIYTKYLISGSQIQGALGGNWTQGQRLGANFSFAPGLSNKPVLVNATAVENFTDSNELLQIMWIRYPSASYASQLFTNISKANTIPNTTAGSFGATTYIYIANLPVAGSNTISADSVVAGQQGEYMALIFLHNGTFSISQAKELLSGQFSVLNSSIPA